MKKPEEHHLRSSEINLAAVDDNGLAGRAGQHLRQCPACRAAVARLREDLLEFGERTADAVPRQTRPVRLPAARTAASPYGNGWLSFFGAAAMAGFALFIYFMGLQTGPVVGPGQLPGREALLEDEMLMREISEMVEYPLSGDLDEIYDEGGNGFDDDFLRFVVPDFEEDYQS